VRFSERPSRDSHICRLKTKVNSCISRQFRVIVKLPVNWNDGCITNRTWSGFQTVHMIQCFCSDSIGSPTTLRLSRSNYQHHEGARIHSYILEGIVSPRTLHTCQARYLQRRQQERRRQVSWRRLLLRQSPKVCQRDQELSLYWRGAE
jgi:hypothetical protein